MNAIWKFVLEGAQEQKIEMPDGARIISVQEQHGAPTMWAIVDPSRPPVARFFSIAATGPAFDAEGLTYVGTFQLRHGAFVGHVFERATR